MTIVSPRKATVKELCRYHSRDFIDFLRKVEAINSSDQDDDDNVADDDHGSCRDSLESQLEEYGLQHDCEVFDGIAQYSEFIAGSTIEAATLLNDDAFDIVIHWDGGRHHAKKDMAAGFCIVNDIVLGIMELQKTFDRVMYIDLDVHHGDGVENAFQFTDKVLTVSLHHYAEGFYPGTGNGILASPRTKAVVNIPLKSSLSERMAGDPLGKWNLSINSYGECLKKVMAWRKPLIVLGGGGYKTSSVARCYAHLTSLILGSEISEEIPEHEYFEDYEPDFMLQVDPGRQTDENTDAYIEEVRKLVEAQSKDL
ncbi:Histone deacetylase 8 [Entomortierella chlamydospora]|uniref:histone deacetylase n=1 Tax=Entomortierella chlamydospora TaxID=101097 RepID=A0A9P6MXU1_9FUNG|nr:Histone deacetylase 8 [Entomortierella chlamydospora]